MSFKEIIGHNTALKILKDSLEKRRSGISYLFYGPSGVGKSFTAKQFAKALNCQSNSTDCCDSCNVCRRSDNLQYPDLHWLDLSDEASNIKIEQIRLMQADINLRPFEGRVKVFVINNCQLLTQEAANCLLKVLEEPPADSVIILISATLSSLLPTIVSRCQKIKFSSLKRQRTEEILREVYKLDNLSSHYLAYYLDGRIGDAITLSKSNFLAQKNIILDKFRHSNNLRELEELFKDRSCVRVALSVLIAWFRDVMYLKTNADEENIINQDRIKEIREEAAMFSYSQLSAVFGNLTKSFEYLDKNINVKLLLDNLKVNIWKS